jgi:transcriptional regulator with XRE-family HTH domain
MDEATAGQEHAGNGIGVDGVEVEAPAPANGDPEQQPEQQEERASAGVGRTPLEQARHLLGVNGPSFARRLRETRQDKHWTRLELANRAGVAPSTVSNLEREKSDNPDPVVALALAIALGYETVADLLGEQPAPRQPDGPGPMTLERLVESLLRGVWAAQGAREPDGSLAEGVPEPDAVQSTTPAGVAQQAVLRSVGALGGPGAVALSVGVVVLVEPRTVG